MNLSPPKKVKRANQYVVTKVENQETPKHKQEQFWFSTKEEANKKYEELKEDK